MWKTPKTNENLIIFTFKSCFYHIKMNIFTGIISDVNTAKINSLSFHERVPHYRHISVRFD